MNRNFKDYRKSYQKNTLEETNLPKDPFLLFGDWFTEVEQSNGVEEVNAMTVATIGTDGFPKSRIVLLKHYDEHGFVFYTNYTSDKGLGIAHSNKICISFFWPNLERQVIIKGTAEKITEAESLSYFQSRPRGSQLGAWASDQSAVIPSRETLEEKLQSLEKQYEGQTIPKPPFWGGYRIKPISFEFWQGRDSRLHDRILYQSEDASWKICRLSS